MRLAGRMARMTAEEDEEEDEEEHYLSLPVRTTSLLRLANQSGVQQSRGEA